MVVMLHKPDSQCESGFFMPEIYSKVLHIGGLKVIHPYMVSILVSKLFSTRVDLDVKLRLWKGKKA